MTQVPPSPRNQSDHSAPLAHLNPLTGDTAGLQHLGTARARRGTGSNMQPPTLCQEEKKTQGGLQAGPKGGLQGGARLVTPGEPALSSTQTNYSSATALRNSGNPQSRPAPHLGLSSGDICSPMHSPYTAGSPLAAPRAPASPGHLHSQGWSCRLAPRGEDTAWAPRIKFSAATPHCCRLPGGWAGSGGLKLSTAW